MILIGIDPGKTGGVSIMQTSPDGEVRLLEIHIMPQTEQDIKNLFEKLVFSQFIVPKNVLSAQDKIDWEKPITAKEYGTIKEYDPIHLVTPLIEPQTIKCILEAQHAFPGMGAGAQWTFAQHYGFLRGVLVSLQIPFREVAPQTWMGCFGFRRQKDEDKKKHKLRILQKAQNLYPHSTVALQTADSLMLCEYLRIMELKG